MPAGAVTPPAPGVPGAPVFGDAGVATPPVPGVPGGGTTVPAASVTPPAPGVPGGATTVPGNAGTPSTPGLPPGSTDTYINYPAPPVPPTPPNSTGVSAGTPGSPTPGTPGSTLTLTDLLTPPGIARTLQNTASSVMGATPPGTPPVPGGSGSVSLAVPGTPSPIAPLAATGLSNLVSPPSLTIPSIPGLPVPLPNTVPVPSDLLCVGTDWSASQGDSAATPPAAEVPRVVTGAAPTGDRRDRWGNR